MYIVYVLKPSINNKQTFNWLFSPNKTDLLTWLLKDHGNKSCIEIIKLCITISQATNFILLLSTADEENKNISAVGS